MPKAKAPVVKKTVKPAVVTTKAVPAPPHIPNGRSIVTRSMRSPDYLVQRKDCTLDGCVEKARKKKNTKLKINYKKMFG